MIDASVLEVLAEGKVAKSKGEQKHYIPFTKEEFALLRRQYGKPDWMPKDFKELLQAIGTGVFTLSIAKK